MTPVANFLISPNLLTVSFTDISTGTPTSWSWDFGDSTAAVTTQNAPHTYATAGTYVTKLTVTNADGTSYMQRQLVVASTPILPVTLKQFVNIKLPSGITFNEEYKDAYIAQWQLFIQPLVTPDVSSADVFNETAYPPLANALIAYLAAYSLLLDVASGAGTAGAAGGSNGANGLVKKIVTGPSEVEFQDTNNAQKVFYGKDGLLTALSKELCTLASRLMIKLPMCPPLPDVKILNVKAGRPSSNLWAQYPWDYPITC